MALQNPTPTTELEAINQMLRAIGETPVSSLSSDEGIDIPNAVGTLSEVNNAVQLEGWEFNTETDYPLPLSVSGEINIPANALSVDFKPTFSVHPVQRGSRAYDRKNHTYTFTDALEATIIFGLPFDELPEAARYYITYRACRKLIDTEVGSEELHKYTARDEAMARVTLIQRHSDDLDLNMLRDTPEFSHLR